MNIYISASLANAVVNAQVTAKLRDAGHQVTLPQEFCPADVPHEDYPDSVYRWCVDRMEECDVGLLLMDCYGLDTAWELGWFAAREKPAIGFTQANMHIAKEFMVRGSLNGVITTNEAICEHWQGLHVFDQPGRQLFGSRQVIFIPSLDDLSKTLERLVGVDAPA